MSSPELTTAGARPRLLPHRPFPPYAYLPGRHPHPVRDPAGHSHGEPSPAAAADPPLGSEAFRWGADLFNHGYYWEAHEAWEPLWRAASRSTPLGQFLKGLILLSAAGVKIREGKPAAAARHSRRAAALFRKIETGRERRFEAALGMPLEALAACAEAAAMTPAAPGTPESAHPEPVFGFVLAAGADRRAPPRRLADTGRHP